MKVKGKKRSWGIAAVLLAVMLAVAGCGADGNGGNGGNGGKSDNVSNNASGGNAADGGNAKEDNKAEDKPLQEVQLVLDWSPNTNHTGLYVARDKGYFEEQGLKVDIIQPGQEGSDAMVASGKSEFGVSVQETVTMARIAGVPIVSIAAVLQHNTSGFASPVDKGIDSPKKFEGMKYGGWGAPIEEAVIDAIMRTVDGDISKVDMLSIGDTDFFAAVKRDIDFAWIFYGWTGIEAELRNEEMNMLYLTDYSDKLDYYTPVLVTSEDMIANSPEVVTAFSAAVSKGYQYAIDNPADAAEVLIAAEPDLNPELVRASQQWLSPRYQDDAPRWGEQKLSVWSNFSEWLFENKLLEAELDAEKAFTNEFLPQ
ncbi:ABC transporter substrate-binding protein [Paenibacillus sp. J5C_2022]|nr:ABC transporter substrate-binding protein [Paenibacillus sp. J5C2022]MCU6708919.1 ABC transporter substrate-binding protein [Paenibacillus sp. J5C2022]